MNAAWNLNVSYINNTAFLFLTNEDNMNSIFGLKTKHRKCHVYLSLFLVKFFIFNIKTWIFNITLPVYLSSNTVKNLINRNSGVFKYLTK